jgi:hypothetical protein
MTRIWDWKRAGRDVSISGLIEPLQRRRVVDPGCDCASLRQAPNRPGGRTELRRGAWCRSFRSDAASRCPRPFAPANVRPGDPADSGISRVPGVLVSAGQLHPGPALSTSFSTMRTPDDRTPRHPEAIPFVRRLTALDPERKFPAMDRVAPATAKRKFTTYPVSVGTAIGLPGSPNKQLGSLPA